MRRVKLIVTGDLERKAMVASLKRYFESDTIAWDPTPRKVHEITTGPLCRTHPDRVPGEPMKLLATALIQEAITGKDRGVGPADLVVAICDVEIGNLDQEEVIVDHLRRAVAIGFADLYRDSPDRTRVKNRETLRERCSFHLLRPLAETVFFGDSGALARLRVSRTPLLNMRDVEQFECVDPGWLPECERENASKRTGGVDWWREERHPKRYLDHLLAADPLGYDEVRDGAPALRELDWPTVTRGEASPFLRSLFQDLADFFEVENPLGNGPTSPLTSLTPASPPDRWLRNL